MADFVPGRYFKYGSLERMVADELVRGNTREQTIRNLFPKVGKHTSFIFYENVSGRRGRPSSDSKPKPLLDQRRLFIYSVEKTVKKMVEHGWVNPEPYSDRILLSM